MMPREEFQRLLREFDGPLKHCIVRPQSDFVMLREHDVKVCCTINILGEPKYVEAELDLRSIRGPVDVVSFAGKLLQAFEQAAEQERGGASVH